MFRILMIAVSLVLVAAPLTAAEISVDFLEGTLNGHPFWSYGLDDVTDMLGRPDRVWAEKISYEDYRSEGRGEVSVYHDARLYYADLGLRFSFRHSVIDSSRSCSSLRVILVESQVNESGKVLGSPFSGVLSPAISASTKKGQLLESVSGLRAHSMYGDTLILDCPDWNPGAFLDDPHILPSQGTLSPDVRACTRGIVSVNIEKTTGFVNAVTLGVAPRYWVRRGDDDYLKALRNGDRPSD